MRTSSTPPLNAGSVSNSDRPIIASVGLMLLIPAPDSAVVPLKVPSTYSCNCAAAESTTIAAMCGRPSNVPPDCEATRSVPPAGRNTARASFELDRGVKNKYEFPDPATWSPKSNTRVQFGIALDVVYQTSMVALPLPGRTPLGN